MFWLGHLVGFWTVDKRVKCLVIVHFHLIFYPNILGLSCFPNSKVKSSLSCYIKYYLWIALHQKTSTMKVTPEKNEKIGKMIFGSIYPLYLNRLEKWKNPKRAQQSYWMVNGFWWKSIQQLIKENVSFASFFEKANIHPNAHHITGVICGYRIEEIPEEFGVYRNCRYLDKLVDELANGRKMEKILGRK